MKTLIIFTRGYDDSEFDSFWYLNSNLHTELNIENLTIIASYKSHNIKLLIIRSYVPDNNVKEIISDKTKSLIQGDCFVLYHSISKKTIFYKNIISEYNNCSYSSRNKDIINFDDVLSNKPILNQLRNSLQKNTTIDFNKAFEASLLLFEVNKEDINRHNINNACTQLLINSLPNSRFNKLEEISLNLPGFNTIQIENRNIFDFINDIKEAKNNDDYIELISVFRDAINRKYQTC